MENRIDHFTSIQVDLAMAVSVAFGWAAGVEVARDMGIDIQIFQRVLLKGGPMHATNNALVLSSRAKPCT